MLCEVMQFERMKLDVKVWVRHDSIMVFELADGLTHRHGMNIVKVSVK